MGTLPRRGVGVIEVDRLHVEFDDLGVADLLLVGPALDLQQVLLGRELHSRRDGRELIE